MDHPTERPRSVYVYEAPVRLWHWINAIALTVLAISGYLIGSPPPSLSGEASQHFLMGDIRFIHFTAAFIFAIGMLFRIYWAFRGNQYSRELFLPRIFSASWWKHLFTELRWYLFIEKKAPISAGHNPLAQLSMFFMFVLGSLFMICTGFALYAQGLGPDNWADTLFGWVIPLFGGNAQTVHVWHNLGMWFLICFTILHIYISVREDIVSRQTMVSTMINGWRLFKD